MKSLHYKITTQAPVIIPKSGGEINLVESEDFIPGSVIWGTFANYYLINKNIPNALQDTTFKDYFLSNKIIFTNAMLSKYMDMKNYISEFFPYCYQFDKPEPNTISNIFNQDDEFFEDKQLKSINGLFAKKNNNVLIKMETVKEINFHHARDRKTGTSEQGTIFNYEAISKGQTFCGQILGNEHDLEEIKKLFTTISTIFLGRSKTSQYGKCLIEFGIIDDYFIDSEYNQKILLTLKSDTIIYNNNGFSSPDLRTLQNYLTEILGEVVVLDPTKAFIKHKQIENFISIYKIKRIKETAISAGSCFEMQLTKQQFNKLQNYLISGIGIRQNEGFGRIAIDNSDFEEIIYFQSNPKLIPIYLEQLNNKTKVILKNIFEKKILEISKNKALEVVRYNKSSNERKLPNSQIGNIEVFVKNSENYSIFRSKVDDIADKKSYRLKDYYINNNYSFHDYLMQDPPTIDDIISENILLREIYNTFEYSDFNLVHINQKIFKIFYITLISGLRKKNKS